MAAASRQGSTPRALTRRRSRSAARATRTVAPESSTAKRKRESGQAGSKGTYAAPARIMPRAAMIQSNDRSMQIATVPPDTTPSCTKYPSKPICPAIKLFVAQLSVAVAQSDRMRVVVPYLRCLHRNRLIFQFQRPHLSESPVCGPGGIGAFIKNLSKP